MAICLGFVQAMDIGKGGEEHYRLKKETRKWPVRGGDDGFTGFHV